MKKFLPLDLSNFRKVGTHYPHLLFWIFIFYTVSLYTALGTRLGVLAAIRHELLVGAFLIVASIWVMAQRPITPRYTTPLLGSVVFFFLVLLMAVPFAYDPAQAWETFFEHVLKTSMFGFFLATMVRTPRHLGLFMGFFLFALFWIYQESVRGLITGELVWYNQGIERLHGSVNLYRSPNSLSAVSVAGLPFLQHMWTVARQRKHRLYILLTGSFAITCIIFTGSRAGYLSTILLAGGWWLTSKNKLKTVALGAVALVLVLVFFPEQYVGRFNTIGEQQEGDASRAERIQLMKDALGVFQDHPLGVGIDCFILVNGPKTGRYLRPHNLWLQVASDLGVLGVISFLSLIGSLFYAMYRVQREAGQLKKRLQSLHRRSGKSPPVTARAREFWHDLDLVEATTKAFRLYLVFLLFNGMFAHILYKPAWWLLVGGVIALNNAIQHSGKQIEALSRRVQADAPTETVPEGRS